MVLRRKATLALLGIALATAPAALAAEDGRGAFARPATVPFPADNPFTVAKAKLGETLFFDPRLSRDNDRSCASCHVPDLGFEDGRALGLALGGGDLPRAVPTTLNAAWGEHYFWDGRADSLEAQALGPIQAELEMAQNLDELVAELNADAGYRGAFAAVFADRPAITPNTIAKALATYQRTLVSGVAPFDRWVAGQEDAIGEDAKRGFAVFTGTGNCAACHSGWAFTDAAFHDIGLPGTDKGRGAHLAMAELDHAFKTPTLRDLSARAPFMHDGSLATLEAVVEHYASGINDRPTLSDDLRVLRLDDRDKADLVAFLRTLDADLPPPGFVPEVVGAPPPAATLDISQKDKTFNPGAVVIQAGQRLKFHNDDTRSHNIRLHDAALEFNSGIQDPGQSVEIPFSTAGTYHVFCGVHPKMKLTVEVK
ncbi:cytochrome c peroxidase [Novispirillum sp. DQ9]|uniref:cytochrome c peroxidase n=1 Tax=Novispirillum sp. DQ9 TaxID=3398612 RepID=UPI003C7B0ACF